MSGEGALYAALVPLESPPGHAPLLAAASRSAVPCGATSLNTLGSPLLAPFGDLFLQVKECFCLDFDMYAYISAVRGETEARHYWTSNALLSEGAVRRDDQVRASAAAHVGPVRVVQAPSVAIMGQLVTHNRRAQWSDLSLFLLD